MILHLHTKRCPPNPSPPPLTKPPAQGTASGGPEADAPFPNLFLCATARKPTRHPPPASHHLADSEALCLATCFLSVPSLPASARLTLSSHTHPCNFPVHSKHLPLSFPSSQTDCPSPKYTMARSLPWGGSLPGGASIEGCTPHLRLHSSVLCASTVLCFSSQQPTLCGNGLYMKTSACFLSVSPSGTGVP